MLANNVIFISFPKIATTSCAECDTCVTDTPVRAATPTPTTSSTPAAKLVFAKRPPTEAITQVSSQPDRGKVPNCCRSTCLDYVTIQSPAYAAKQECFH